MHNYKATMSSPCVPNSISSESRSSGVPKFLYQSDENQSFPFAQEKRKRSKGKHHAGSNIRRAGISGWANSGHRRALLKCSCCFECVELQGFAKPQRGKEFPVCRSCVWKGLTATSSITGARGGGSFPGDDFSYTSQSS